jgi:hypothetical protein
VAQGGKRERHRHALRAPKAARRSRLVAWRSIPG